MVRATRRSSAADLAVLLLVVMIVELALNRLAVPALRPATETPGAWHRNLDRVALFIFHFATVIAIGALGRALWETVRTRERYTMVARALIAASGAVFLAVTTWAVVGSSGASTTFVLQAAFTLTLLMIVAAQITRAGDPRTRVGLVLLSLPLLIHFYGPFALRVLHGADPSMYPNLPDPYLPARVREWGQWSLVLAAMSAPYCFAPLPLRSATARVAPLVIATFVGLIAGVVIRQHYEVGMEVAMRGLGFDMGPHAPRSRIALIILALVSMTWTLVACTTADTSARRRIGVGIGLVVLGGYAFSWPLQYLVGVVGVLLIGDAAHTVAEEESAETRREFRAPPIDDEAWQRFVAEIVRALRAKETGESPETSAITTETELGIIETKVLTTARGIPIALRVARADGAVQAIDVQCGASVPRTDPPAWSLHALPERKLAMGTHPEPPSTSAPTIKTGDFAFDRRFRVRDAASHTDTLLDDALRARATAMLDGWLAYWPGKTLYYRVFPGRGAPLDTPIPVTELAFRGADAPQSADKLLTLLDLLTDMAERAKV